MLISLLVVTLHEVYVLHENITLCSLGTHSFCQVYLSQAEGEMRGLCEQVPMTGEHYYFV